MWGLVRLCCLAFASSAYISEGCSRQERMEASALFKIEAGDVSQLPQCKQAGVTGCEKVSLNLTNLTDLKAGQHILLTPGGIPLTFEKVVPGSSSASTSYVFATPSGLEALFTLTWASQDVSKETTVTGSIHHDKKIYVVESCGKDCTLLYYRDQSFFNDLQD